MNYNDEELLSPNKYEEMANAYANALKQKGFMIVAIDDDKNAVFVKNIFELLAKIKLCLFKLGGFLNTSQMYSLTNRQIKKIEIMFDSALPEASFPFFDKTKCFLNYISLECELIKNLIALKEQSNFEVELNRIVNDRLSLLSQITKTTI